MSKFSQTKLSELINYQGSSLNNLKKFLRKIEKNQRNSINIFDTIDKQISVGICLKLWEFRGLKKEKKEIENITEDLQSSKEIVNVLDNSRFYIRYFLNMYNLNTRKMYGNTYQSPYYEVKLEGDNEIKLLDPKPFSAYFLSPDPENDAVIIQFVVIETDVEDKSNVKSQISERWSILKIDKYKQKKDRPDIEEDIFKGSPRYLLYNEFNKFDLKDHKDGVVIYSIILYFQKEKFYPV